VSDRHAWLLALAALATAADMGQAGRAHVVTAVGATPVIFRQISAMLYVALLALVTDPNARVKPLCTCARRLHVNHVPLQPTLTACLAWQQMQAGMR